MRYQDRLFLSRLVRKSLNETIRKETQGRAKQMLLSLKDGSVPDQRRLWRDFFLDGLVAAADARCTLPRLGKFGGQRLLAGLDVRQVSLKDTTWFQCALDKKMSDVQRYLLALAVAKEAQDFARFALKRDEKGVAIARFEGDSAIVPGEAFVLYANNVSNALRAETAYVHHVSTGHQFI